MFLYGSFCTKSHSFFTQPFYSCLAAWLSPNTYGDWMTSEKSNEANSSIPEWAKLANASKNKKSEKLITTKKKQEKTNIYCETTKKYI